MRQKREHRVISSDNPQTAPIPIVSPARNIRDSFRSLTHANYRRFQLAHFVLHTGAWMFRIAVDWLALEITGDIAAVGVLVFIQWAPMIFLGPYGAMIADRFPKRATVAIAYALFAILATVLGFLTFTGVVELWHIVVIAFVTGLIYIVEVPARVVLLTEMVPAEHLQNAISVYAIVFWLGGVIGPVVSGILIATAGTAWSILVYALACAGVAITVWMLRVAELRIVPPTSSIKPQFRATLRYARSKPTIFFSLVLLGFFAVFALPIGVVLSGMAKFVYESGSAGFGLYSSLLAAGALVGALLSTRVRLLRLRTVIVLGAFFATAQLTLGFVPSALAFMVLLVGVGCVRLVYEVVSDSLVQLSCNPLVRGRIVSLYVAVLAGGQALGGPMLGALSDALGPRSALILSAGVALVATIVIGLIVARRSSLTLAFRRGRGVSMLGIVSREPN
ncbi:MAG: MFS transporter [Salinibacterium sp.]|nr:MFS transporter [Salinibacterium sp.]